MFALCKKSILYETLHSTLLLCTKLTAKFYVCLKLSEWLCVVSMMLLQYFFGLGLLQSWLYSCSIIDYLLGETWKECFARPLTVLFNQFARIVVFHCKSGSTAAYLEVIHQAVSNNKSDQVSKWYKFNSIKCFRSFKSIKVVSK